MSNPRSIARNALWNAAGTVANLAVGFVLMRFLYRHLGDTRYGWWLIIAALTSYFDVFDLGLRGSVGRNVAFYKARNDQPRVNALVCTAFWILCGLGGLILIATFALPNLFFAWYDVSLDEQASVRWALWLVGFNLALTFPLTIFDGVLWAFERFDVLNAIDIPMSILRGVFSLVLVMVGGGLVELALVIVAITLATAAFKAIHSFRADPELRIHPRHLEWQAARELFNFGFWQFVLSIGRRISGQIAGPVIGALLGPKLVPLQSVAARLPACTESLVSAATGVLTPVAAGLHATDRHEQQRRMYLEGGKFCTALALFFVIFYLAVGQSLITLWIGPGMESAGELLAILAVGELLPLSQWIGFSVVLGMGRHRELAWFSILEIGLIALLIFFLVRPFGLPGVCLALAIPGVLCRGVLQLGYTCRLLAIPLTSYLKHVIVPAVTTALPPATLLAALCWWRTPEDWFTFLAYAAVYGMAFLGSGCLILLGWEQTRTLLGHLRQEVLRLGYRAKNAG